MSRRNKYGNKPVTVDGIKFASGAEARRYRDLTLLHRAGEISELDLQTKFPIQINGIIVCTYRADFTYLEHGKRVVEDVKSKITAKNPVYRLKKKLLFAAAGIEIKEIF